MGKARKQTAAWMVFLQGILLTLAIYLGTVLLAALLAVKGALSERSIFQVVAASCTLSVLVGGLRCVRLSSLGRLSSGVICSVGFILIMIAVGLLCWKGGVAWMGKGGILLLCALAGGILTGLLGGKRGRRVKRKAGRK